MTMIVPMAVAVRVAVTRMRVVFMVMVVCVIVRHATPLGASTAPRQRN